MGRNIWSWDEATPDAVLAAPYGAEPSSTVQTSAAPSRPARLLFAVAPLARLAGVAPGKRPTTFSSSPAGP
ncbi:MAG: hypothetical protein R2862_11555 [Thermoanaerobaculia bacterium]